MVDKFVLPSDLPEEPAAPAKITVRPADARPAFVLPSEEEEKAAQPKRTNTTVLDYPEIYTEMRQEAQNQVGRGLGQLKQAVTRTGKEGDEGNLLWGLGNVGFGALGYIGSPINAAYRAVIGEPGEQRLGVPKEYSEFAAQLATPGLGLKQIGKPLPYKTKTAEPKAGSLADEGRLYTKEGQETQAGLALKQAAKEGKETPEQVRTKLADVEEIIPGSEPTTFQASGNYGLGQLERGVQTKAQAPFQERRAEQAAARQRALETTETPGNPEEVANNIRERMRVEDAIAESAERTAVARAEEAARVAAERAQRADRAAGGTGFTPDISGQVFQRELTEANTASRNAASRLWEGIDPQGRLSVNADPVINADFRLRNGMTLADAETITDAERRIQGVIGQYTPVVSFAEMRSLRSLISDEMRAEMRARGPTKAYGRMAELRTAVEQSAVAPFEAGVPAGPGQAAMGADAAERLAAATAATKERSAIFKTEPVQGIVKPGQGGEQKMTPSAVPGRIIPSGPKGYDTVNAYLRATQGRPGGGLQEVTEALVADLRARATDVNGNINPTSLRSWANSKQHALRAVAERDGGALARRLDELEQSTLASRQATANVPVVTKEAAAQRAAVSKRGNEGIFGDLMGLRDKEDISKLLGSIFGSKTAVADARNVMARLTTPEARDGARRAISDWITNKLVSNTAAGTTEINVLRADQFQSFIRQNGAALREFGFTPEQINTMQLIARDMRRAKMSIDATKIPGGSNTAQDLYAMRHFGLQGSRLSKMLHIFGGATGGIAGGPLGAVVGFLSAGQVKAMRDAGIKSVQDLIVEGMVDPAKGHYLLGKTTPQENIAFLRTMRMYAGRAARTPIAGEPDRHDQPAPAGYASGGTVRPLGREGIKARNKARAVEARERSSLARRSAQAKRKVRYQNGGSVPYPVDSPEFKEEVARALAKNQDTIAAAQEFYPRVPLNDKAWSQFIENAPASINIEDRRPGYKGGLRAAYRRADGGGVNADSSEPDPLDAELKRRNTPGGLSATAGSTVTSTTPVQDIPAPKVNKEGETLPTYVLKEMGKGLLGAPEQFTHAAGDLQRRGEYAGSQEDMPYGGPPPEEMPAGAAAALMLYGANAPFPKPGIGVFGGRGAMTANKGMLAEAEKMLAAGVPHATIRNRTGWEFGSEGKPKFEISDAESRVIPEAPSERVEGGQGGASRDTGFRPNKRLEEVFHHPALYEAYPWLRNMRTSLEVGEGIKPGASYTPPTKNQKRFGRAGEIEVRAPTYERGGMGDLFEKQYASDVGARDMLLHEIQHAIQEREGFAPGSNPRQLPLKNSEVETIAQNMAKRSGVDWDAASLQEKQNMIRVVRHRIYKAQAGETEARNVQTRADSTLPSRASWETEDIKRQNQMIDKNRRLKRGEKPFEDAKIYKSEYEGPEYRSEYKDTQAAPAEAVKAPEVPMLLGNPELRGSMSTLDNMPFTYRGKGPAEWTPQEFAEVGKHFGVERLGPESPATAFRYSDNTPFNIPGGLEGQFTYYDMLRMKADGIDPSRIPRELHIPLHQKLMRSMDVAQPVSPERTWSGLMFGMTSPNNPLFPNQLTQSILRMREPGLRQQLANSIPWKVGDAVSQEERLAASNNIANMLGIDAESRGGLGVRGSTDYTRIAELAQMWEQHPQWFTKTATEDWPSYVERLTSQVKGTAMKTGSFGGVWQDPMHAGISAIDRHMVNEFERTGRLFKNRAEQRAFEKRAVDRWNDNNEDRPVRNYRQLRQASGGEGFLTKMKLEYVGNEQNLKLRTRKGEISPNVPPHLANAQWPSEPSHVKVMGEAYRRALDWNQRLATQQGLNLFPSQWLEWDRIRRRLEPHENMFPGLERMPAMSREQLRKVSDEHTASGHKTYEKVAGEEEGQMGLQPTRPRPNPAGFAYFTVPPVVGAAGVIKGLVNNEEE